MLAMKQQFEEVNGAAIEDQPAQDAVFDLAVQPANEPQFDPSANDALYDPDTAAEREVFYDNILKNPDMEVYNNDDIAWKLSDTGNEQAFYDLKERADTSGGELGLNHAIEKAVDNKMQRFDGSLSQNLSEAAQETKKDYEAGITDKFGNWDEGEELALKAPQEEELELNMPEISYMLETEDPNVAVQAIYFELSELGVNPNELDQAMTAGNDYDVLDALAQVADDNGINGISEYGNNVQAAFAEMGVPEAIQNIAPDMTQIQPAFAANDPQWDLENNQPKVQSFGMS